MKTLREGCWDPSPIVSGVFWGDEGMVLSLGPAWQASDQLSEDRKVML